MGYGCVFLFVLLLGLADQSLNMCGGKKRRRVGFQRRSRRPSLFLFPLFTPLVSFFYIFILLHGSVQEVSGSLFLALLCWPLGHVYTSAATRPLVYIYSVTLHPFFSGRAAS